MANFSAYTTRMSKNADGADRIKAKTLPTISFSRKKLSDDDVVADFGQG